MPVTIVALADERQVGVPDVARSGAARRLERVAQMRRLNSARHSFATLRL